MLELLNCKVAREDGEFSKDGKNIEYSKYYLFVKKNNDEYIKIKIDLNKDQYVLLKQIDILEFAENDGLY